MSQKKILIAYFSRSGNTEAVMKAVQNFTGGDLFRIEAVKQYPKDYREATNVAKQELQSGARPELTTAVQNTEQYDTIILGFPNWWNTMPAPVFTFLETYDFTGKILLPLCTHGGSGLGRSEADLKAACPGANVLAGLAIRGGSVNNAEDAIKKWLKQSAY